MTVIAAMITLSGTAHATDSLLTVRGRSGERQVVESQETKVIGVRRFRGALAYWGYAGDVNGMRTIEWLSARAAEAEGSSGPEEFAQSVAVKLEDWLKGQGVHKNPSYGIGIHFSAYEHTGGVWVPELFLISNFTDQTYSSLRPDGVGYSRETFKTTDAVRSAEDSEADRRRKVHRFLLEKKWLRFNNGDPGLFNLTANAVADMLKLAKSRGTLEDIDVERLRKWTRLPVETVSRVQQDFYRPGTSYVGGKIHDLAVTPTGEYSSGSGDKP